MKRLLLLVATLLIAAAPALTSAQNAPAQRLTTQPPVQDFPLPRPFTQPVAGLQDRLSTLAARPHTPENALALGILQALSKQYADAGQTLAKVKTELPAMAGWARLYLSYSRFKLNDYRAALAELETVDFSDAAFGPEALLLSAYCLEALGSPQELAQALERYQRFLALPDHPFRSVALWRGAVLAASGAASGNDFAMAQHSLRELILTQPWTPSADKAESLARELFLAGRITFNPDCADCLRERIELLLDKSQTAKALALIDRLARAPDADQARALYLKAKALFAKRDTQTSIQLFEDAARLSSDPLLAAWAVYHQGRGYWRLSGPDDAARMEELLGDALRRAGALPEGAELAEASRRLLLLSRIERGRFQEALPMAVELAASGPEATEAREQAAWLTGLIRFALADFAAADAAFTAFLSKFPNSDSAPGAHYWLGRTREAAGDLAQAKNALRLVLDRWPNGYYGMLAAKRLAALAGKPGPDTASAAPQAPSPVDQVPVPAMEPVPDLAPTPGINPATTTASELTPATAPPSGTGQSPACPGTGVLPAPEEAKSSLERAAILEAGLLPELAERELAAVNARFPKDPAVALGYARVSTELNNHLNAVRAVSRAFGGCLARGTRQELQPLRGIVYPNRYPELIAQNLAGTSVDPNLIRGLIRQESFFEPSAQSGAGAVGLMQVLPGTARSQAEKYGEKGFKAETLKDPAVNIRYGVRFFLERYEEYGGNLALTLASYNAGRVKIGVWREFLGGLDQELFVECIPYTETREYVKRILGNQAMYGLLY